LEHALTENRRLPWLVGLSLAAALACLPVGCGDSSSARGASGQQPPGANDVDSGAGGSAGFENVGGQGGMGLPTTDGGFGGIGSNRVEEFTADPGRSGPDVASPEIYEGDAAVCYETPQSCGIEGCGAFASCCVSTGACCQPIIDELGLPSELDFRQCAGQELAACSTGDVPAAAFGLADPVISDRGLVPNGNAEIEGGALIGDPVNLSSLRVELSVQFTLPIGCGSTCLQSAGVAFTASAPDAFVDADVGLLLSGSRDEVSLMIGNAVAAAFDAGTDDTRWQLVLSPEGTAEVFRDDISQGTYPFDAAELQQAQLVVFGRNLGAISSSAAVASIDIESSICDNPSAWQDRAPLSVTFQGNDLPGHASGRSPSVVDQGATRRVAYEVDGEIFVAAQAAPGVLVLDSLVPALMATEPFEALGVGDPELVADGGSLFLFYTARSDTGAGSIRLAVSDVDPPAFTKDLQPVVEPGGDVVSYDAPTVFRRDGLWVLIARATLTDGATELHAFYTNELGIAWTRIFDGGLEHLTRTEGPGSELTDPSLIVHNSAYHLYYARRTGTRWAVELAMSDELLLWRPLGEVLSGSGTGFDSLGATSPDAISGPDQIDLVYSGQNGVSFDLGTATRIAPSETALLNF